MKWTFIGSVERQPRQIQRVILMFGVLLVLLIAFFGQSSAFARYEQRRTYQESPLSPVATPINSALPAGITVTLPSTLTSLLTATTSPTVTTALTSPLATPAIPLTTVVTTPPTVAASEPVTPTPAPTADLINQGQTSLLLVGAVLGGLLVVIAVVLSRQR